MNMNLVRAFIAIEIPSEILRQLQGHLDILARTSGQSVRWVKPDNFHLTLKFFGETEQSRLEKLDGCLKKALEAQEIFDLTIGGFGAFPNFNRPRVFWCGLSLSTELKSLQEIVERTAASVGFPAEDRPFSPHLTIGRSSDRSDPPALQRVIEQIRRLPAGPLGSFKVERLVIFRSQLAPGGSIYTHLFKIPFGGNPQQGIIHTPK